MAAAVASTLPEDVVVSDESNTAGVHFYGASQFSPRHSWDDTDRLAPSAWDCHSLSARPSVRSAAYWPSKPTDR